MILEVSQASSDNVSRCITGTKSFPLIHSSYLLPDCRVGSKQPGGLYPSEVSWCFPEADGTVSGTDIADSLSMSGLKSRPKSMVSLSERERHFQHI